MERKNTLLVFTLSSILVLAGFSINQDAYAGTTTIPVVDDLHCWFVSSIPLPPTSVRLTDQFLENQIHDVIQLDEICAPVQKIADVAEDSFPQDPFHWTTYLLPANPNPQVIATVNLVDQFHPNGFEVDVLDNAEILMVPADKLHGLELFENVWDNHYKCYDLANTNPVSDQMLLTDQFAIDDFYTQILPVEICTPVVKEVETSPGSGQFGLPFGLPLLDEHYLCYEIGPKAPATFPGPITITDQFLQGAETIVTEDSVLCTIAQKTIVPPPTVGGTDVTINTSALLLAGVQSISMWMIPVVIAGVGIGVFVIKRRK